MSAQAFFSSFILASMNSWISPCQSRNVFILAARRVLPPDFTTLATWSYTFRNDNGPLGRPPPLSFSLLERMGERSVPVPEPNLNSIASLCARCMMDSMLSCTDWMKHALHCGYSYCVFARSATPVLGSQNQFPRLDELPMWYW